MQHVVIGANGFLGAHLCKRLLADGHEVVAVLGSGSRWRLEALGLDLEAVPFADVDWSGCDAVILAAGFGTPMPVTAESAAVLGQELDLHRRVLTGLLAAESAAVVCSLGSRTQYGRVGSDAVDESVPRVPTSLYAAEKCMIDDTWALAGRQTSLRTVRLRITNPYGPLEWQPGRRHGLVSIFLHQFLDEGRVRLYGGGVERRDYLWIDDLIDLVVRATASSAPTLAINAGAGIGTTIARMASLLQTTLDTAGVGGLEIETVPMPPGAAALETGDFVASIAAAEEHFGWRATTTLEQGLALLVEDTLERRSRA